MYFKILIPSKIKHALDKLILAKIKFKKSIKPFMGPECGRYIPITNTVVSTKSNSTAHTSISILAKDRF